MKKTVIIGAGPAGLTAAYELLKQVDDMEVVILEESDAIGGIAKTVNYKGNRMDMGGHRFFSKSIRVNDWWQHMLPIQGDADPDKMDEVMLLRRRVSRILFNSKFYDYPISINFSTIKNMGFINTLRVCTSYLNSVFHKLPETNLENFYINRFGKVLYSMFFESYTENLWGRNPKDIDASWGRQRIRGLSVRAVVNDYYERAFNKKDRKIERSLIKEFKYPKFGPGQMWELVADKIVSLGGKIEKNACVTCLKTADGKAVSVGYETNEGHKEIGADNVISSMPLKDMIKGINDVPEDVRRITDGLPYRDYMMLGVLIPKTKFLKINGSEKNDSIIPDCWIYIQDKDVRVGRIQIYNNWSPYMVKNVEDTVWLGMEYFVNEGDLLWNMGEENFSRLGVTELKKLRFINSEEDVMDTHMEKVKKAYPAYFDTYSEMSRVIDFLNGIENLYCVGRNGQHRYNNMDHSMITAFEAVNCIVTGNRDKTALWNVNTENEYHEDLR